MKSHYSSTAGFTLIELLVVVTLIVVLAGIGIATYATSIQRAKEAVLKEDLFRLRDAISQYQADKDNYPADLPSLVTNGYIRRVPADPFTKSVDTWQTIASDPDPANPGVAIGIEDITSGAGGVSLDGSRYAEW